MAELFLTDYTPLRLRQAHSHLPRGQGRGPIHLQDELREDLSQVTRETSERGPGDHGLGGGGGGPGGRGRAEGGLPDELARGVQAPGNAEGDIDQTSAGTGEWELNYSDNKG